MRLMGIRGRFFTISVLLFCLASVTLVAFQNCSQVRLTPFKKVVTASTEGADAELLPIPKREPGNARVVIIVDQSFSMVWNKCPQDLDGTAPSPTGSPFNACERSPGVDQQGNRHIIIQKWLQELQEYSMGTGDVKVMLLPFSGGKAKRPRPAPIPVHGLRDQDYMKFLPLTADSSAPSATKWLNALRQEQDAMIDDGSLEYMGTTIFDPIIDYARAEIAREAQILKDQDKLSTTPFEVVFISDGVYKPTMALFGLLRQVSGCPDCNVEPEHIACTCFSSGCWSGTGLTPGQYCRLLEQNFREYIGDPQVNNLEEVKVSFNNILSLEQDPDFIGLRLSMRFAKMNWQMVPPEDKNVLPDITKNIFEEIQKKLIRQINVYNISGPLPPFPIISLGGDSSSYVIENLYAINTNAYVDKFGKLITDSDGDGAGDDDEIAAGLDPSNPRSNAICLDGITLNFGCQVLGCRPEIDADKDGLNECEEVTIGTRNNILDTDSDHIPDYLEALRFLKPSDDDHDLHSSGDDFSDHDHFRQGVHPIIKLSNVIGAYKVDMISRFMGFEQVQNESGQSVGIGKYAVELNNMPLVKTRAVNSSSIITLKETPTSTPIPQNMRLDPGAKAENINRVYFLLQMNTLENRKKISWHLLKMDVPLRGTSGTFALPKGFPFKDFVQIQGERP